MLEDRNKFQEISFSKSQPEHHKTLVFVTQGTTYRYMEMHRVVLRLSGFWKHPGWQTWAATSCRVWSSPTKLPGLQCQWCACWEAALASQSSDRKYGPWSQTEFWPRSTLFLLCDSHHVYYVLSAPGTQLVPRRQLLPTGLQKVSPTARYDLWGVIGTDSNNVRTRVCYKSASLTSMCFQSPGDPIKGQVLI